MLGLWGKTEHHSSGRVLSHYTGSSYSHRTSVDGGHTLGDTVCHTGQPNARVRLGARWRGASAAAPRANRHPRAAVARARSEHITIDGARHHRRTRAAAAAATASPWASAVSSRQLQRTWPRSAHGPCSSKPPKSGSAFAACCAVALSVQHRVHFQQRRRQQPHHLGLAWRARPRSGEPRLRSAHDPCSSEPPKSGSPSRPAVPLHRLCCRWVLHGLAAVAEATMVGGYGGGDGGGGGGGGGRDG